MPAPNTTASSGQAASTRRTTDLYRACMSLATEGRSLLVENEGMKRLGLNAQVMAVHTGQRGGSLEVIVAEISRLSTSIREILGQVAEIAFSLNETSIGILHLSHLRLSYAAGWKAGIDPQNHRIYQNTFGKTRTSLETDLSMLEKSLSETVKMLDDLGRIAQQIPPISSLIRIVVAEIQMKSEELLGTVADLTTFHELLEDKIERMREIRRYAQGKIDELREESA
jgi:chaperonin cofactor prefoldin